MKVNKNIVIVYTKTRFALLIRLINKMMSYQSDQKHCNPLKMRGVSVLSTVEEALNNAITGAKC